MDIHFLHLSTQQEIFIFTININTNSSSSNNNSIIINSTLYNSNQIKMNKVEAVAVVALTSRTAKKTATSSPILVARN
jgi:hypothetical protein